MTFLEKTLEDIIFETDNALLKERGLDIKGKKYRQVRIGNYGIADIVTLHRESQLHQNEVYQRLSVTIYELKKENIDANTLMQAFRYKRGIDKYFEKRGIFELQEIEYRVVLIGKQVNTNGDFVYLMDSVDSADAVTYSYNFDGIRFMDQYGWYMRGDGFESVKKKSKSKDDDWDSLPF